MKGLMSKSLFMTLEKLSCQNFVEHGRAFLLKLVEQMIYHIYLIKPRGAYLIFGLTSVGLIQGRGRFRGGA